MSLTQNLPPPRTVAFWRDARWLDAERARVYGAILAAVQALGLLGLAVTATRGFDRNGEPLGTDFVSFWTAARLALSGAPASVYDPAAHHAAEQALLGAPIDWYAFFYPPVFLLYCLPFALLPYFVALPVWLSATAYAYWRAIRLVAAEKIGALPILAFPGVFCTLGHGQNALLSTALLGGGAALLGSRPALAGALFGALCYKPQLAVVIPLGLAVAGRWRALAAMAATVAALAGLSLALFGPEAWRAFLAEAPLARATLEQGLVEPSKMQSVFSAVRMLGGGLTVAYVAQTMTAAAACLTLIVVVRATRDALAQGVAIAAAALLVTPFLLDYDLTLMAIPLAYLLSRALTTGFLPYEKTILLVAYAFPVFARPLAQYANLPLGPIVAAALLAALARRILADDAR